MEGADHDHPYRVALPRLRCARRGESGRLQRAVYRGRGALTVRHVLGVEDPDEYAKRAEEWARSAWEAWGEHHDRARAWVAQALAERGRALMARGVGSDPA